MYSTPFVRTTLRQIVKVYSSLIRARAPFHTPQGHTGATALISSIYYWGQGVAVDQPRAVAGFKVAAKGGDARCQCQVGMMYQEGRGVDVDYAQARAWFEKAAAQDFPGAVCVLGMIYFKGDGVTPSWRRAREYIKRAAELGDSDAVENLQHIAIFIQNVTSQRSIQKHSPPPPRDSCATSRPQHPSIRPAHTRSTPPCWTSGWRSTARAGLT